MTKITDKDKEDWKKFLESKEPLDNKDSSNKNFKKHNVLRTIDLHGYTLEEANTEVKIFIEKCFHEGVANLNIVTGKGSRSNNIEDPYKSKDLAILKYSVPDYIKNNQDLMKKIIKIDFESVNSPLSGSFNILLKKK